MPACHAQLADWLNVPNSSDGTDLGRVKQALAGAGVNARGWRLYLEYGDALFAALGRPWVDYGKPLRSRASAVAFLKLLAACEMDVPPPRCLVASLSGWGIPRERIEAIPVHFFRTAWKACLAADYQAEGSADAVGRFVRETIVPLATWFFTTGQHVDADANRLKAGWPTLEREFLNWRMLQIMQREKSLPHPPEWPPFVTKVDLEGLRFVAIASDAALLVEGDEMSHCIGSYGERCRTEMLRAFSVRNIKTGERVATLTVKEIQPGTWEIDAIKGYENAVVPDRYVQAAFGVVRTMEDAYAQEPRLRREFDMTRANLMAAVETKP